MGAMTPRPPPDDMFCISLRPNRKIKPGVWKFTVAADIFGRRELATMGQLFCIKIIEDLHKMGHDLDNGSHPQIPAYNKYNSTCNLWFKKVTGDRPWVKVIYVALEKLNKVILINHNNQVKSNVEEAVENAWPLGIKRHKEVKALGHELHEIKMNSSLWQTCGGLGTGDPDIDMNRIVDKIIDNLGKIKIRSVGVIKINGQTSIFLTSPVLEVLHTGVPRRFAKEEEGIRVWSVE